MVRVSVIQVRSTPCCARSSKTLLCSGVGQSKTRTERSAAMSVRAWLGKHVVEGAAESAHAGERADADRDREHHEQEFERRRARLAPGDLEAVVQENRIVPPERLRPSRRTMRRPASRAQQRGSCVTSTSVVPSRWLSAISSSRTCWPFCAVEVAGGLVGQKNGRPDHEGAGQRDALLLAAGELDGIMIAAVGQTDAFEQLAGALAACRNRYRRSVHTAAARFPRRSASEADGRTGRRSRSCARAAAPSGLRSGR